MRLGGPVQAPAGDPAGWVAAVQAEGYRAAYCPVTADNDPSLLADYVAAAAAADLLIAEVGAWSNPLSPDPEQAKAAFEKCCRQLDLAERVGARCCVNIAGSRNPERWDGPHPDNLSEATFAAIVTCTQRIIDTVGPAQTCYCLETMPWIFPDSAASYARLLAAVDRPAFAVHLDPVNLVNSPAKAFDTTALLHDCFAQLGPHIRSCHAKDIRLDDRLTVHLDECRPGLGCLDYATFLRLLDTLDPDTPLLLEHLPSPEQYRQAAAAVRDVAASCGVSLDQT